MAILPNPPSRTWQDVARELACETNRERIAKLADELDVALEEKDRDKPPDLDS